MSLLDDPPSWAKRLEIEDKIIIVGHLPYLSKLASLLIVGS
ncbi:MAG: hypothetical protein N2712_00245 [Brevinematales bacterium]|nr:hypothetical protein [Brevinematales bacterium]